MSSPMYPNITVPLTELDGNAFVLIGATISALKKGGVPKEKAREFINEAVSDGYNAIVRTIVKWVNTK